VASSKEEGKILGNLEISLWSIQKGQILDRLYNEWNELFTKSRTNYRSTEAIRGRRQQPESKAVLADLQSKSNNDYQASDRTSVDSSSSTESESDSISSTTSRTDQNYIDTIKNLLRNIIIDNRIQLSAHMKDAIDVFLTPNGDIDPVQITMNGIY
jgi:UTP:GlnB (protein PII) uridylyltransferase